MKSLAHHLLVLNYPDVHVVSKEQPILVEVEIWSSALIRRISQAWLYLLHHQKHMLGQICLSQHQMETSLECLGSQHLPGT